MAPVGVQTQDKPAVQMPKPGVAEIMTLEGKFVRAAYNNEGYVILGYQLVNRSIGEEWMLLEVGMTVLDRTPAYRLEARGPVAGDAGRQDALPLASVDGAPVGPTPCALQARERGPARLDQLLSADGEPGLRASAFFADLSSPAMAVRRGGTEQRPAPASAGCTSTSPAASPMASTGST